MPMVSYQFLCALKVPDTNPARAILFTFSPLIQIITYKAILAVAILRD